MCIQQSIAQIAQRLAACFWSTCQTSSETHRVSVCIDAPGVGRSSSAHVTTKDVPLASLSTLLRHAQSSGIRSQQEPAASHEPIRAYSRSPHSSHRGVGSCWLDVGVGTGESRRTGGEGGGEGAGKLDGSIHEWSRVRPASALTCSSAARSRSCGMRDGRGVQSSSDVMMAEMLSSSCERELVT